MKVRAWRTELSERKKKGSAGRPNASIACDCEMVVACDSTLISHHSGYLTLDKEGVLFLPDLKKEVATPVIAAGRIRVKGGRSDSKSDITFTVQPDLTSPFAP